jgi:hypothetical protein
MIIDTEGGFSPEDPKAQNRYAAVLMRALTISDVVILNVTGVPMEWSFRPVEIAIDVIDKMRHSMNDSQTYITR